MKRLAIATSVLLFSFSFGARADAIFDWNFVGPGASGTGTLTAVDEGGGTFFITGGAGTVSDSTFGSFAVTFATCTFGSICSLDNTGGNSPNITYDNRVAPGNSIGSQLIGDGVALTPGPPGSGFTAINLYDGPSQLFYSYNDPNGFENLTTPFNVTAVPAPSVGAGAPGFALAALFLGWIVRRRAIHV